MDSFTYQVDGFTPEKSQHLGLTIKSHLGKERILTFIFKADASKNAILKN